MTIITLPLIILPIEDDGFHLQTHIKVNGKKANLIIDTGASRTVFDEKRIDRFTIANKPERNDRLSTGLGTNTMESKSVIVEEIQMKSIVIKDYKVFILNLEHVNESYQKLGLQLIDGILGGDILYKYNAVIDYSEQKLLLKEK